MNKRAAWRTVLLVMLLASSAGSIPVPLLDLDDLTNRADLIVLGQVVSLREVGVETIEASGVKVDAAILRGEIRADRVLKGPSTSRVAFRHWSPVKPVGYRNVQPTVYRIYFLRAIDKGYVFVSPYHPSVVANPGIPSHGETVIDAVVNQVAGVLLSSAASATERMESVYVLSRTKSTAALEPLRASLATEDRALRLSVASALLARNDTSGLAIAVEVLLAPRPLVPDYILHNLNYAISEGVQDEEAIPALTRLLGAADPRARRAATAALRRTGSHAAVTPLLSALRDSDLEVRYYAVVGLAEITGQLDWRPNMDAFVSDQSRYLSYWLKWGQQQPRFR
jgi:hypothetical protein